MQETECATEEGDSVNATNRALFDDVYMALHHESPCDPDFQKSEGLVDESGMTSDEDDQEEDVQDTQQDAGQNELSGNDA
ncbi:hypothetical protein ABBQ32_013088 [Trebouxia sp. C0010 RCD-2024]